MATAEWSEEPLVDAMLRDVQTVADKLKKIKDKSKEKPRETPGIRRIMQNRHHANKKNSQNAGKRLKSTLNSSVVTAIKSLAGNKAEKTSVMIHPNLATNQEHVNRMEVMHRTLAKALDSAHVDSTRRTGSKSKQMFVPTCTVDMDNEQLRWGRKDVPLCTAGQACVATRLAHAPGPLHAFTSNLSPNPSLCLLCIRLHAQMINKATIAALNVQASLVPPFTNLVNCPGGYHDWALGVNTKDQRVFSRQCAIVGACPNLKVRFSPLDNVWWVDQSEIVWRPTDFRQGAQTPSATLNSETANSSLPGTV